MGGHDPVKGGVEQEENDHRKDHQVHIDEKQDTAVVPAPDAAHAANVIDQAGGGREGGKYEERRFAVFWKVGEEEGSAECGEDENRAAKQGTEAQIE